MFLFNSKRQLLITRRAHTKKTFPGVWTNSVCGHPGPDEDIVSAAKRRLKDELGIDGIDVHEVSPYRYTCSDIHGIVENEICPILVANADVKPKINSKEVADWKWINWDDFLKETMQNPTSYSPWSIEEASIIAKLQIFN